MCKRLTWRWNASTNTDRDTGAERYGVRELRPIGRNPNERETKEKNRCEAQEVGKEETELAFPLSASLPLRATLPLLGLIFAREPIPREATASNLRAHDSETLRPRKIEGVN